MPNDDYKTRLHFDERRVGGCSVSFVDEEGHPGVPFASIRDMGMYIRVEFNTPVYLTEDEAKEVGMRIFNAAVEKEQR